MLAPIRHGARNILRFSGRDKPEQFWPYILTLFIVFSGAMGFAMREQMIAFQRFAAAHPAQSRIESGPGRYSISIEGAAPELIPATQQLFVWTAIASAVFVLLAAAAVSRRLHDRDRSAMWGLLPLPFLGFGLFRMPALFEASLSGNPDVGEFLLIFANNAIYIAAIIFLIVMLTAKSTDGPNRFGPRPE